MLSVLGGNERVPPVAGCLLALSGDRNMVPLSFGVSWS